MMKMAGEYQPITSGTMTAAQILQLVAGTPLEKLVAAAGAEGTPTPVVLEGRPRLVLVLKRGSALQVRIGPAASSTRAKRGEAAAAQPAAQAGQAAAQGAPQAAPPKRRRSSVMPAAVKAPVQGAGPLAAAPAPAPAAAPAPAPAATPAAAPAAAPAPAPPPPPKPNPRPAPSLEGLVSVLVEARAAHASDVHVVSDRPVLVRVAGELLPVGEALPHADVEAMLTPLLDPRQREALATRGYVDLGADYPGAGRLRANVSRQKTGLKGSFRLVMSPLPSLESLQLPAELAKVTTYHQGLVVIAGPSGHGKTTTLAAVVDVINASRPHHILTVEEPVEFVHPPKRAVVSQRDVGLHTKSFATALKASLREDPDVIVIGELRDRETVEIAMTAAETGHLVIATMSTPSAAKTIDRLIDLFPPEDQQQVRVTLAGALKFVVAQRLLPNVAKDGFVPAVELLTGSQPLWALIRDNKLFQLPSLQQRGRAFGMIRFDDSLMELFKAGKITEETALRFAENKKDFGAQVRAAQPAAAPAAPPQQAPAAQGLAGFAARAKGLLGGKG
jgi:twitching motility protein PilT